MKYIWLRIMQIVILGCSVAIFYKENDIRNLILSIWFLSMVIRGTEKDIERENNKNE